MEENKRKRPNAPKPGEHVPKERPRTPASGPKPARPRKGNAASRESARRETRRERSSSYADQEPAPAKNSRSPEHRREAVRSGTAARHDEASSRPVRLHEPEAKRSGQKRREPALKQDASGKEEAAKKAAPKQDAAKKETHKKARRGKKPHRVYNTNFGFKFAVMLAVVAVVVLSMVIFFKVKHINVILRGIEVRTDLEPAAEQRAPQQTETDTDPEPAQTQPETAQAQTYPQQSGSDAETEPSSETQMVPEESGAETETEQPEESTEAGKPATELVEGHSYYTAEEIIAASGIHLDDNLLSLSKDTVAARIIAALPYVCDVQIKKQLPGTVVITVTEYEVTYGIQDEKGGWWLMNRNGRILEPADEKLVRGHLIITGMPIKVPQVGEYFKPASTEGADMSEIASKQNVVLDVIPALETQPFVKELVRVDVSTSYDLTLWYGSRYEIRLGTTVNLDYKLQFLQATLESGEIKSRSGTIDLTFSEDDKVHFLPFS